MPGLVVSVPEPLQQRAWHHNRNGCCWCGSPVTPFSDRSIYLADHLLVLPGDAPAHPRPGRTAVVDVKRVLLATIDQFQPTLPVFSWRDIQIYAPVDGRVATLCRTPLRCSTPATR